MTTVHQRFLEAVRAFLKQETVHWEQVSSEEWEELLRLAAAHQVLPMVVEAVFNCPAFGTAPPPLVQQVRLQIRTAVVHQMTATSEFLGVYAALLKAGVRPLVVKGLVCRSLYPMPDWRRSGDEDVLIDPREYWLCKMTLAESGLKPEEGPEDAYEVPFFQKDGPLHIELHRSLFPQDSDAYGDFNALFADVRQRAEAVTVQGQEIWTLCPTDNMLYLICHAYKHFLHSGFGIRQVCDMMLYANAYGPEIDWQRVLDGCRAIRAEKFAAALFAIGRERLIFDPDLAMLPAAWREIRTDHGPLLEDLLSAGIYGKQDPTRLHSSNITLDAVAAQKQGRQAKTGLMASLFPSPKDMKGRYPYLKKYPWLLPVAWGSRIVQYSSRRREEDNSSAARILRMGSRRLDLLRQYDIID